LLPLILKWLNNGILLKNGELAPEHVTRGNDKNIWWLGKCGHEWRASVHTRLKNIGCPYCVNFTVLSGFNDLATVNPEIASQWHPTKNGLKTPDQVVFGSSHKAWWVCNKGHEWKTAVVKRVNGTNCPRCYQLSTSSKAEQELYDFLTSFGFVVEKSNRKVLGNRQEVDLFIPEKNFAIEFNGLYWHNESWKGDLYHYEKSIAARDAGIQLIHIWEDDWLLRKELVLRMLAHKLGVTERLAELYSELYQGRVYARKLEVVDVSTAGCDTFLAANHLDGPSPAFYRFGLSGTGGVLRAVLTLTADEFHGLRIVRYATAGSVPGGFTRLLTHALKTIGTKSVFAVADYANSDGNMLIQAGFTKVADVDPDYMFVIGTQRKQRNLLTPEFFQNSSKYVWEEDLIVQELADMNRIPRIWNAGHVRYQLHTS
jgi:hypothetical protein